MPVIAVSSYSFHRLVKSGEASLADAPRMARHAGADAVEFAVGGTLSPPLDQAIARELHAASRDAGMPISGVCVAAELLRGNSRERAAVVNYVRTQLDAAAAMGASRFRHDASLGPENGDNSESEFESALSILVPACRVIAEHAAQLGITSSIENHGRFVQHAERVTRLVEAVNHPGFGVTLDIGNSLFARQDPVEAAARLAPFAITVHVKDFEIIEPRSSHEVPEGVWATWPDGPLVRGCVIGEGNLDMTGCLKAILRTPFQGPFVVEFEGPSRDPRIAAAQGVTNLKAVLRNLRETESGLGADG